MKKYSTIGKRVPRVDARAKVTGAAKYSADIVLPRMLYGKILRSPYPHANILRVDTSQAERLSGVKAVVTAGDALKRKWGPSIPTGVMRDEQIFASDKVRYIGDEVAAVAATDEELAEEACGLISVEYQELPAVFDPEEAMQPGAPKIHDHVGNNIVCDRTIVRGDVEKGFQEADVVVEERFTTPPVVHSQLEPISCVASWDANGKLTIWLGSMWPFGIRGDLAYVLGLPVSQVRVINCHVGGAFGNRIRMLWPFAIAALLSKKAGLPVKIVNTREEEFMTTRHRTSTRFYMKIGAKKDGAITAEHVKVISDPGAYAHHNQVLMTAMGIRSDAIYRFPNVKWELKSAYTNNCYSTAAFRGLGSAQPAFVRESMIDILAEKLGMDTAEVKLKNAIRTGDVTVHGWRINSSGLSECIRKTTESAGWKEKKAKKQPGRGIGIASMVHESDMRLAEGFGGTVALVKICEDGKINVMTGEAEYGQGGDTACAMVAAEELGVPIEQVEVTPVDTDISPYGLGPFGSKLLITETSAVYLACQDAKRQLLELASKMLGEKVEELKIGDGKVSVDRFPEKSMSIAELGRTAVYNRGGSAIIGKGVDERDTEACLSPSHPTCYGHPVSATYFDTLVAEVEVNEKTGEVKVLELTVACDCGKVINLNSLEGQIQGARAQGIGWALLEEQIYKEGRMLNSSYGNYKIPTALDLPSIKIIFVESNEPSNPYGAKGGGENTALDAIAPAIANAIYDAIGVRIRDLPITPDKILKALEAKGRGGRVNLTKSAK